MMTGKNWKANCMIFRTIYYVRVKAVKECGEEQV